jgi:hypothetical protein
VILPIELGYMTQLQSLNINEMDGTLFQLASGLGIMSRLQDFVATGTWLMGSLPIKIYSLTSLERLLLSSMKLTRTLPSSMCDINGNMPNLTTLELKDNALNIMITTMLGSLPNLEHLQLQNKCKTMIYMGRYHPLFHM